MYDIAVYGSGFAAYALAAAALERGKSVLVVERGAHNDPHAALSLSRIESRWEVVESGGLDAGELPGQDFARIPRYVGLGGTSVLWSGKWRPLDDLDFRRRRHARAWPVGLEALAPHYAGVAARFRLPLNAEPEAEGIRSRAEAAGLRIVSIALPKEPVRLAPEWERLAVGSKLGILCDAQELDFLIEGDAVVESRARLGSVDRWQEISAGSHVVAAGGIASAALVRKLQSTVRREPGPFLGGYMDHPKGIVGSMKARRHLDDVERMLSSKGVGVLLGVSLPESEVLESGLGNHTLFMRRATGSASTRLDRIRGRNIRLTVNAEQFPESWNGVEPGNEAVVQWRVSGDTRRDVDAFLRRILPRLEAHFGAVQRLRWLDLGGASHPAGCTPYGDAPSPWELHADGRVEGLSNVFCVSSSGFPFAGSANPTFTIAALGDRLAARLAAAGS